MFDLSNVFIAAAFAQDAAPQADTQGAMMGYLPFILIFAVFYFLVIRPQQKKISDQEKMLKALQKGDRVITSGGIHGKVTRIEDAFAMLEIADGVQIKIDRDNIAALEPKVQPAASGEAEKK